MGTPHKGKVEQGNTDPMCIIAEEVKTNPLNRVKHQ